MDYFDLKVIVQQAIDKVFTYDSFLFDQDASEWAIAHRLAMYLEQDIPEWDVDCEYNRQGSSKDIKKISSNGNVRPDIIIHHRGELDAYNNLLVIEVKKHEDLSDSEKVCEYTKPPQGHRKFQYQFGLALSVIDGPKLNWYEMGRKVL